MRSRLTVLTFATDKQTVAETTSSHGPLTHKVNHGDSSSSVLARRGLLITSILALAGAGVGAVCIPLGMVAGIEIALVLSCVLFTAGVLVTLLCFPRVALQTVATVSTIYFAINLTSGVMIAVFGRGEHLNLFVYLVWFFPLLVFNKLVNQPAMGRFLARILLATPLFAIGLLLPRLLAVLKTPQVVLLLVYCISYACYAAMLNVVTRYREAYIIECARVASLKVEAEVLESISDCFISLDSNSRLVYLNDAACAEFCVERRLALNDVIHHAVPGFFSPSMLAGLQAASCDQQASHFEAPNMEQSVWYDVRCFPRIGGMSVYFRNITEAMSARRTLEQAQSSVREQAELLDKAQDAIFVQDMETRILYWNKSAERLYGRPAREAIGRRVADIFCDTSKQLDEGMAAIMSQGEWSGVLSQRHRDGRTVFVESRCTLVHAEDGTPRSILSINTDITNRRAAEARIEHLAFFDILTELPNRLLLRERLERTLATAIQRGNMGALLFIDLDDFKTINDTLGHGTGDVVLQQVALRLASCVRQSDTVARLGGDEFAIMLEGLSADAEAAIAEAKAIGNKVLRAFLQPYNVGNYEYAAKASIGITLFPMWSGSVDELLKRAELAVYQAKARGRNMLCFFEPAMQQLVDSRAELQSDLRRALHNGEFELHYQPQVDNAGHVTGAEGLLRWKHPRRGMVPPGAFIPLVEEAGLIVDLGHWVLETACSQLAQWATRPECERLILAVNVSIRQFLDANFVGLVREVIRSSGANPHRLKLEITESAMLENAEDTIAKMTVLKESGVGFSLDDFGTGYSSLSRLSRLPLDQLKIDRSFVKDVLTDPRGASIVRTVILLGKSLNLSVIAEGVETEGQRAFLEGEGCYSYQGYLFAAALTAARFEIFVATGSLV
jgi:diguanylate cyclase (GGDEF)-like protein/PAS domain S-box-containing protein